jgi:hypothetical protein
LFFSFKGLKRKKAEDHALKIENENGKENCIDRGEIPPIIIDFDDDEES